MLERIIYELGNYKWFIVGAVIATVILSAYLIINTKEFEWTKHKVRIFSLLYDLDTPGRICFVLMLSRLMFIIFLAATGGTSTIWEAMMILIISIIYGFVSGEKKNFLQIFSYIVIYAILLMERLFLEYYQEIEETWIVMFLVISFALFAVLYSIHQTLTGYELLLNTCAARDRTRYDKGTEGRK